MVVVNVAVPTLVVGVESLLTHGLNCAVGQHVQFFRTDGYHEELRWRRFSATQIGITADVGYAAGTLTATVMGA